MEFEFSVDENETPPPSGFDLGHIDVLGGEGTVSSRDRGPDGAMVIHLSVTLLLLGLRRFLCGEERSYRSAAVDSSFSLAFTRMGDGSVETTYQGDSWTARPPRRSPPPSTRPRSGSPGRICRCFRRTTRAERIWSMRWPSSSDS
ncbi:hypothetical protein [Streptomyces mutabilis]|uniref:hypothetical protein n=1 Tax=Streptomyces mutabilis TaxID=67332 RepID=UPI000AE82F71|nr:hypothetical protein [Streptomyces mutabilis]